VSSPRLPGQPVLRFLGIAHRVPDHIVNGITVAVGIGLVQVLFAALAGSQVAQLASVGALCASLADRPNTSARTRHRVLSAAVLACTAVLIMALLEPYPLAVGVGISLIAFVAMMTMAWGPRAGPVSFAPILALVFVTALPSAGLTAPGLAAWSALGAAVYLAWALAIGELLQPHYRRLALAAALHAVAQLFRSRAGILQEPDFEISDEADQGKVQLWIDDETALADHLQAARDLLFVAPDTPRSRRETAVQLRIIELRDILLASRLDFDLLGQDDAGRRVRRSAALRLWSLAASLDIAEDALRGGDLPPAGPESGAGFRGGFRALSQEGSLPPGDPRAALLPGFFARLQQLTGDVSRIHALLRGAQESLPLSTSQLRLFVAPEGWPLDALRSELSMRSPVFRHALRMALALGSAYFIARALPWASHPHWLVLSVAVVLRGTLEQTLARRNERVLGTVLGCLIVLLMAGLHSGTLLALAFLVAVGVAHAFVTVRYLVTALAGTVMALLQLHMADPGSGFAIAERVADTVLGALLAWSFSYVLPSWERRTLPRTINRTLLALQTYAGLALSRDGGDTVAQRLARRKAYDALGAVAGAMKRSTVEPKRVRLPVRDLAALVDHGQMLMAHLSVVRLMLARASADLERPEASAALKTSQAALHACLSPETLTDRNAGPPDPAGLEILPVEPPAHDLLPWLLRRLRVSIKESRKIRQAAAAALAALDGRSRALALQDPHATPSRTIPPGGPDST
jgi:uncharacterized membrane protein YccC